MLLRSKKILYKDWVYEWLIEKRNYVKESTYANYTNIVFNHIVPNLGIFSLNEINHKLLQDFILSLSKSGRKTVPGDWLKKQ